MTYGYSDFDQFTLDVYTGQATDVQLPPIKTNGSQTQPSQPTHIYIHTLKQANCYSSLAGVNAVVNGWNYTYDFNENDFLKFALSEISVTSASNDLVSPNKVTQVYTTLRGDRMLAMPSIFSVGYNSIARNKNACLHQVPTVHGPAWIGGNFYCDAQRWYQHYFNNGHTLAYKQTIPGLIFEFDSTGKFMAIIAQPLETEQLDLRTAYIERLIAFISNATDFTTFKAFIDEDTTKYVDKPCTLTRNYYNKQNITTSHTCIVRSKTLQRVSPSPETKAIRKEQLLIKYLDSTWPLLNIETAIGMLQQFFNIDQLTSGNIKKRDPRVKLETVYLGTVYDAFLIPLDTYTTITTGGDKVLIVPNELLYELKDDVLGVWLGVTSN